MSLRDEFVDLIARHNMAGSADEVADALMPRVEQEVADSQAATVGRCLDAVSEALRSGPDVARTRAMAAIRALSPDPHAKERWELEVFKKALGGSPLLVRGGHENGEFLIDAVVADSVSIADLDRQLAAPEKEPK